MGGGGLAIPTASVLVHAINPLDPQLLDVVHLHGASPGPPREVGLRVERRGFGGGPGLHRGLGQVVGYGLPRLVVDGSLCAGDVVSDHKLIRALQHDRVQEPPHLVGGHVGLDQVRHHAPVVDGPGGAVQSKGVLSTYLNPADEMGQGFMPELGELSAVELGPGDVLWGLDFVPGVHPLQQS